MKSIKVKQTINKGNYENISIEIELDRPAGMLLLPFLQRAKDEMNKAIEVLNK